MIPRGQSLFPISISSHRSDLTLSPSPSPSDPIAPPPPPPPDLEPERAASVKRERSLDPLPPPPNQPVAGPSRPVFRRDSPIVIDDDSDSNSPPRAPPSQRVPTPPSPKRVKRELSPIVFSAGRQSSRDEPIELSSDDDTAIEFVPKKKMKKLTVRLVFFTFCFSLPETEPVFFRPFHRNSLRRRGERRSRFVPGSRSTRREFERTGRRFGSFT